MALRARLIAPPIPDPQVWPWHIARCGQINVSTMLDMDRRMEAESYLLTGFGLRESIKKKKGGWRYLRDIAHVQQPSRLKAILVPSQHGTPFLSATQVFDAAPAPRKFLAACQMAKASECFVQDGTILVTRSGTVGRVTLSYGPHREVVISDDLLRVRAKSARDDGMW